MRTRRDDLSLENLVRISMHRAYRRELVLRLNVNGRWPGFLFENK